MLTVIIKALWTQNKHPNFVDKMLRRYVTFPIYERFLNCENLTFIVPTADCWIVFSDSKS